jgi:hypothetical protein
MEIDPFRTEFMGKFKEELIRKEKAVNSSGMEGQ